MWPRINDLSGHLGIALQVCIHSLHKNYGLLRSASWPLSILCHTENNLSNLKSRDDLDLMASSPDNYRKRFEVQKLESY